MVKMYVVLTMLVIAAGLLQAPESKAKVQVSDHFLSPGYNQVTFAQRYWVVDEYWDGSGPVFLYLCGQETCQGIDSSRLFPLEVAKRFNGLLITLEHRFYGESLPTTIGSLQPSIPISLEVNQALADIAEFIFSLKQDMKLEHLPWVIVGGGYAGALAAWFRTRYPALVIAAWASSATVQPLIDFPAFDMQVGRSLELSGKQCADAVVEMNEWATRLYEAGEYETIARVFNATDTFSGDVDKRTVLWMVADTVAKLVVEGHRVELCKGLRNGSPMETAKKVAEIGMKYRLVRPADYSSIASRNLTRGDGSRQLHWQSCSQLGWFQTASTSPMRSRLLTNQFFQVFCNTVFSSSRPSPSLPEALSHQGSNIVYTNGGEDPWQWVSYVGVDKPQQELFTVRIDCEDCSHCTDLKTPMETDAPELKKAREKVAELIAKWLEVRE